MTTVTPAKCRDLRISELPDRLKCAIGTASMRSVAEKAGVSEGMLRHLQSGGAPRLDNLLRIADAIGVSAAWLATGEGSKYSGDELLNRSANRPAAANRSTLTTRVDYNGKPHWCAISVELLSHAAASLVLSLGAEGEQIPLVSQHVDLDSWELLTLAGYLRCASFLMSDYDQSQGGDK